MIYLAEIDAVVIATHAEFKWYRLVEATDGVDAREKIRKHMAEVTSGVGILQIFIHKTIT